MTDTLASLFDTRNVEISITCQLIHKGVKVSAIKEEIPHTRAHEEADKVRQKTTKSYELPEMARNKGPFPEMALNEWPIQ